MLLSDVKETLNYDPITGHFYHKRTHRSVKEGQIAGSDKWCTGKTYKYIRVSVKGKYILAHRLAWFYMTGHMPTLAEEVDHIDHNTRNNSWRNLRLTDHGGNGLNQKKYKTNTSGVTGVRLRKNGKWRARIYFKGTHIDLGTYETYEEAVAARRAKELELGFHPNHGT